MGNYSNKPNSNSSTASGSGDDGPSGIVKSAVVALIGMLMLSTVLSGGALAHYATGVSAQDYIADEDASQQFTVENIVINESESATVTVEAQGINYSQVGFSNVNISGGDVMLQDVHSPSDGTLEVVVSPNTNLSSTDLTFSVDNQEVSGDGVGTVSYTSSDGVTDSASFNYSATAPPATGSIEIPSVTENDTGNETNFSYEVVNSNDTVVASGSDVSAPVTASELETGDYTVNIYGVDNYDNLSKTVSVTENNTSSVNFSLARTTVDYQFTIENDSSALDSFNISLFQGAESDVDLENDSAIASASINDSQSNDVTFSGLTDGQTYTGEVTYTDADGNETTYTFEFTANASADDDGDGVVSQTIDVASDSSSDDSGFIGGVGDFNNPLSGLGDQIPDDPVAIILIFLGSVGGLVVFFWTIMGLRANNPF